MQRRAQPTPRSPIPRCLRRRVRGAAHPADLRAEGTRVSRKTVAASRAARGWPGSALARLRRRPRWSIWMLRCPKTWWGVVSTPVSGTGCGPLTSPTCAAARRLYLSSQRPTTSRRSVDRLRTAWPTARLGRAGGGTARGEARRARLILDAAASSHRPPRLRRPDQRLRTHRRLCRHRCEHDRHTFDWTYTRDDRQRGPRRLELADAPQTRSNGPHNRRRTYDRDLSVTAPVG